MRSWKSNLYSQTYITQNGQNRRKIIFRPAESRLLVNSNQVLRSLIDADQKSQRNLITLGKIPRLRSEFSNISLRYLISILNATKGWNQFSRTFLTFFNLFQFCHKSYSQCLRTALDKRFLSRLSQRLKLGLKLARIEIPHTRWVPLHRFFKNWFLLIQKQLYNNNIQAHFTK